MGCYDGWAARWGGCGDVVVVGVVGVVAGVGVVAIIGVVVVPVAAFGLQYPDDRPSTNSIAWPYKASLQPAVSHIVAMKLV